MSTSALQAHLDSPCKIVDYSDTLLSRNCPDFGCDGWGYLKDNVYQDNPQTIPELKTAITTKIRTTSREECVRVIDNFARRIQVCLQSTYINGSKTKMVCQKSLKLGRHVRQRMKFMCTKYGWNAKKSVHFIDVFMGAISFFGSPCSQTG